MKYTINMISAGAIALAFAQPVSAQDVSEDRIDQFMAIIAQNNCMMDEQVAAEALPANGFTDKTETKNIVGILMSRGIAKLDGSVLTMVGGACGGTPEASPRDRLVAAIEANNCQMTEAEADTMLPGIGLDDSQVRALVGALISDGMATFSDGVLRLDNANCSAPADPAMQLFVDAVVANGCTITKDEAAALLPAAGVREDQVDDIVQMLMATNQASIGSANGRSVVILSDQLCTTGKLASRSDPRTAFLEFMSARNCSIAFSEAKDAMAEAGLDANLMDGVVGELMSSGMASVGDQNQTLTISAEICG